GVEVDAIDERIVDDGGADPSGSQFFSRVDGFAKKRPAANQDDIVAALENLRFAPLIGGVFGPGERIILASDKEDVGLAVFAGIAIGREAFDALIHEAIGLVRPRR